MRRAEKGRRTMGREIQTEFRYDNKHTSPHHGSHPPYTPWQQDLRLINPESGQTLQQWKLPTQQPPMRHS